MWVALVARMRWALLLGLAACGAPLRAYHVEPELPAIPQTPPTPAAPPLTPGEDEIERVVRAHLGDVDLRTCVSSAWRAEVMLKLTFRRTADSIYFQSESLGSSHETSN